MWNLIIKYANWKYGFRGLHVVDEKKYKQGLILDAVGILVYLFWFISITTRQEKTRQPEEWARIKSELREYAKTLPGGADNSLTGAFLRENVAKPDMKKQYYAVLDKSNEDEVLGQRGWLGDDDFTYGNAYPLTDVLVVVRSLNNEAGYERFRTEPIKPESLEHWTVKTFTTT